jgi:hypothetical protein
VIQPHLGTEELDAAEVWVDFLGGVDAISHPCAEEAHVLRQYAIGPHDEEVDRWPPVLAVPGRSEPTVHDSVAIFGSKLRSGSTLKIFHRQPARIAVGAVWLVAWRRTGGIYAAEAAERELLDEANSLAHEAWFFPTEFTIDQAR